MNEYIEILIILVTKLKYEKDDLLKKHKIFGSFRKNCVICAA